MGVTFCDTTELLVPVDDAVAVEDLLVAVLVKVKAAPPPPIAKILLPLFSWRNGRSSARVLR